MSSTQSSSYAHQVAGHDQIRIDPLDSSRLIKPSTQAELAFYQAIYARHHDIVPFLPKFYGYGDGTSTHELEIILENLTSSFKKPCIMDLKLGTRLYDHRANEEKRNRMIAQAQKTTSGSTGVRICGAKYIDSNVGDYVTINRETGRSITSEALYGMFRQFFCDSENKLRLSKDACSHILRKLSSIHDVLNSKSGIRFYSSSILIVYEGESKGYVELVDAENEDRDDLNMFVDVRMIDFAHSDVFDKEDIANRGVDEGYLFGLRNVIHMMERILREL